jgi:hypothetical protein
MPERNNLKDERFILLMISEVSTMVTWLYLFISSDKAEHDGQKTGRRKVAHLMAARKQRHRENWDKI